MRMHQSFRFLWTVIFCVLLLVGGKSAFAAELIFNGGFEDGLGWTNWTSQANGINQTDSWWNISNSQGVPLGVPAAHGGVRFQYLGASQNAVSTANNVDGLLYQTITLPAGTTSATLSYYLQISTDEVSSYAYDNLKVEIQNASGTVLFYIPYSNLNASQFPSWTRQALDIGAHMNLASYSGQQIRIAFHGTTDGSNATVFRLDDVSLQAISAFNFTGNVVDSANQPVVGAQAYFVANGQTYSGSTDGAGHFGITFDPAFVPTNVTYWVTKTGYVPFAGSLPIIGSGFYAGTLTLEGISSNVVVLELVPDVHHLGDNNYGGLPNSQFQKATSEGLTFNKSFSLTTAQNAASGATLTFLAKGSQHNNLVYINGQFIGYLNASPADGSFGSYSFPVPPNILTAGINGLYIESVLSTPSVTDHDDFEFTNVLLRLTGVPQGCSYSLSPTSQTIAADPYDGVVSVTTTSGCVWNTVSNNLSWLNISSGASGTGSGSVFYSASGNPNTTTRSGTLTVAGKTFTVTQAGAPPTYTLSVNASPSAGGSVSAGGNYAAGTILAVSATANSGYTFSSWTGYASCASVNPCTFAMPATPVNLTATFTPTNNVSLPVLSSVSPTTMPVNSGVQQIQFFGSNFQVENDWQWQWGSNTGTWNDFFVTTVSANLGTVNVTAGSGAGTMYFRVCRSAVQTTAADCSASVSVKVKKTVDLTPILMLLLD